MPRGQTLQRVKHPIPLARVKFFHERVTLTRFTALYFLCAIVTCIVLSSLQIVSLAHDLGAISALSVIKKSNITRLVTLENHRVDLCSGLPTDPNTICMRVATLDGGLHMNLTSRDGDDASGADGDGGGGKGRGNKGKGKGRREGKGKGKGPGRAEDEGDNNVNNPPTKPPDTPPSPRSSSFTPIPSTSSPIPSTSSPVPSTSIANPPTSFANPPTSFANPPTSFASPPTPFASPPTPFASSSISMASPPTSIASLPTSTLAQASVPSTPGPSVISTGYQNSSRPEEACVSSLTRLNDVLHDSLREDVVTLIFQIWLFILAFVTVMNQSIAHLGAGLLGHVLGTAWRGYRVHFIKNLRDEYEQDVLPRACNNQDFLGGSFERQIKDAIRLVALNGLALVLLGYFSYKLLNDYANQMFKRVGASPKVQRLYKFVLVFSLCLQLSGFFSLASTAMWIDKVSRGSRARLEKHGKLYLASSIVTLVLLFPWLIIGWIGVRRESRIGFAIFFLISLIIVGISTSMFSSNLYRSIFSNWSFFATITITALIFLIGTTALGTVCRLHFGQGLAHYLQVSEALEEVDFTPAHFDTGHRSDNPEKPLHDDTETARDFDFSLPVPAHSAQQTLQIRNVGDASQLRRNSVYSDNDRPPIQLSSSVPLDSELASVKRFSTLSRAFKKLSMFAPSIGVKSVRREQDNQSSSGGAPMSIKSLPRLSRVRDLEQFAASSPPLPSPPALSYVTSNLSYASSNVTNPAAESQSSNSFVQRFEP